MARYKLVDPRDYLAALDFISRAKENGKEIDLKIYYPKRSNKQNSYLYFCLQWFAHKVGCTVLVAKEVYLKRLAAPHIFRREMEIDGYIIEYYRSTADLDTVEMMSAIENFRSYAEINDNPIPDADDQDARRYCEREIEKTTQFGT